MIFELPKVKFQFTDFEPVIDAKTMEIHLTKHHQAYVNNLNQIVDEKSNPPAGEAGFQFSNSKKLQEATGEELLTLRQELPEAIRQGVINNAGGHYNHTLWWEQLKKPQEGNRPSGKLLEIINTSFGTFEAFVEQFEKAAMTRFGSGWAWVSYAKASADQAVKLEISSTPNQDSPVMEGKVPILGLDVWEHAYYLNYQNRRVDYVKAFWQIVDWEVVKKRLG